MRSEYYCFDHAVRERLVPAPSVCDGRTACAHHVQSTNLQHVPTASGRKVTTPGQVFYPATGTTKVQVVDYYLQVAEVMLPHLAGWPATPANGGPTGSTGRSSSPRNSSWGTPAWLTRVWIRHQSGPKFYPVSDTPAGLGWLGQVAALELASRSGASNPPPAPGNRGSEERIRH